METKYLVFPPAVLYCNTLNVVQLQQLTRGKTMQNFQLSLFYDLQEFIRSSNFYRKYYLLFSCLPVPRFPDRNFKVGRTGYSRHAMLRALMVKHLEQIKSVPRLIEFLDSQPILAEMCGFKMGVLPDETQFYRFIQRTPNSVFEKLHLEINRRLVDQGLATLTTFIIDSKPVLAATRDNNFKNPNRNCRDKKKKYGLNRHQCYCLFSNIWCRPDCHSSYSEDNHSYRINKTIPGVWRIKKQLIFI